MSEAASDRDLVLDAPIVAVTVYPDRARVTRRGTLRLPAGDHRVYVEPLPASLAADSVRVGGRGPATVLGVDVIQRRHPRTADPVAAELEEQRRALDAELAELADADGVQAQLARFLEQLAERAGGSYARALAAGDADPQGLAAFAAAFAERLGAVRARQRELHQRRTLVADRRAALDRRLAEVAAKRAPDHLAAAVSLVVEPAGEGAAEEAAEVQLEVSYVVDNAGWESGYDLRLVDDALSLTWYGMARQRTGEDWPECPLSLSTARPSGGVSVPELDPWYLDRVRPLPSPGPGPVRHRGVPSGFALAMAAPAGAGGATDAAGAEAAVPAGPPAPEATPSVATAEQGVAAATYTPVRPVAVPADGAAHRTTIATADLTAVLDYVTAPVRGPEARLRATVVNDSGHTLPPGRAAVFHGGDFVGSAALPVWAPGEEVKLALGVDDRVRVERELVRRTATKAPIGATRRREAEYRTTVANHTPRPARVTVLDQVPVSRDEQITVRELRADPEPAERGDLGALTWRLELAPGETRQIHFGLRVEVGRGVELAGWRE